MSTKRKVGRLLAVVSALLWAAAAWVGLTYEGVTGPAILLGWIILLAMPMTVAAAVLLAMARGETREVGRR
jgi:hypothetical protein